MKIIEKLKIINSNMLFCKNVDNRLKIDSGSIFFSVMAILFLWMGPVTGHPPSVLAPPIPPWGTPSAAGVAGEHPVPPILS